MHSGTGAAKSTSSHNALILASNEPQRAPGLEWGHNTGKDLQMIPGVADYKLQLGIVSLN